MSKLVVSEIFGPTFQGEGPSTGVPCHFLRLGGCSIQCVWCDTAYTWDATRFDLGQELTTLDLTEVEGRLTKLFKSGTVPMLVVSGGEPMQQQDALFEMLIRQTLYSRIEIETSGHIPFKIGRTPFYVHFNVSPKLAHAQTKRPYDVTVLAEYALIGGRFKFVVDKIQDFDEVDYIVREARIPAPNVYIMPLGVARHALVTRTQEIAEEVVKRQWNLTSRLHILVYGNRRGV